MVLDYRFFLRDARVGDDDRLKPVTAAATATISGVEALESTPAASVASADPGRLVQAVDVFAPVAAGGDVLLSGTFTVEDPDSARGRELKIDVRATVPLG